MCQLTPTCPTGTIVLSHDLAVRPVLARCGRWRCQVCGPRKARRLRARIAKTAPTRFLTLTLRPDPTLSSQALLDVANHAWSILWRRFRRKFGLRAVGYVKVVELTKKGTPHLHILVECPFIAQKWVSKQWKELTGSYIVDVRRIKSQRMLTGYLTSYLTKAMEVPEGRRKWSASAHYVPPEPEPKLEPGEIAPSAVFRRASLLEVRVGYYLAGWRERAGWMLPPQWQMAEVLAPP